MTRQFSRTLSDNLHSCVKSWQHAFVHVAKNATVTSTPGTVHFFIRAVNNLPIHIVVLCKTAFKRIEI